MLRGPYHDMAPVGEPQELGLMPRPVLKRHQVRARPDQIPVRLKRGYRVHRLHEPDERERGRKREGNGGGDAGGRGRDVCGRGGVR